jgi:hypothetical protein
MSLLGKRDPYQSSQFVEEAPLPKKKLSHDSSPEEVETSVDVKKAKKEQTKLEGPLTKRRNRKAQSKLSQ